MKKIPPPSITRLVLTVLGGLISLLGLPLLAGWLDLSFSQKLAEIANRPVSPNWVDYFRAGGGLLVVFGLLLAANRLLSAVWAWGAAQLAAWDRGLATRLGTSLNLVAERRLRWPLDFTRTDGWVCLGFVLLAAIFQLAALQSGFPNVILGGDAANIASFAAGRAYPELFRGDAILGNLNNLGLYVTVHLPIAIFLEKLLGNFGLAYSVLLFPHVFMQYFSYYLFGRVLFEHRYWAVLFSLAVSAPLILGGGEMWGVMGDAMPRFTYQVLIPFILILLLSAWRERPERWPWVMAAAGLMAFIHPVSTPTWAFALWLGFWPILPVGFSGWRKLGEMFKLGLVLSLALLPYVSIYLTYHQGGQSAQDYDLVYGILLNYFPTDLLNIPGAVGTLLKSTSQFGLLWFGLLGLALTALLFKPERSRLGQLLTWVAGIAFVTILVPWVEQGIERTFRMIPLQTEVMRGMRYLVPFLFIFWFYPLAQLTQRAVRPGLTRAVFAVGTLLTLSWLLLNPPYPIQAIPPVVSCWAEGKILCPGQTDYADALSHVRTDTPEGAAFVVFLTNRWSGIEVRYLGLRPMVYAYKDRGQLAFTNLEALRLWNYYLERENAIFSRNNSPTLELKQERMLDFALDAEANYLLTDFPLPADVETRYDMTIIYQNGTFTILEVYKMRP